MIVTVTFNPALDKSTSVQSLVPEKKMRCSVALLEPGGGGINVARALTRLGIKVATAFFWGGGCVGQEIERLLANEGVSTVMIPVGGDSRENMTVYDNSAGCQYRFVMQGPEVSAAELEAGLRRISASGPVGYLVASGSLSPGMPAGTFARLGNIAADMGAKYIVDTSGDGLAEAVKSGVYLVKPSLNELALLTGLPAHDIKDVVPVARTVIQNGHCENIVVSMGAAGAVLVTQKEALIIPAPVVNVRSTVGAGDSMVAGIVCGLATGQSLPDATRFGVACGSAATLNPGTGLCKMSDVQRIHQNMMEKINIKI